MSIYIIHTEQNFCFLFKSSSPQTWFFYVLLEVSHIWEVVVLASLSSNSFFTILTYHFAWFSKTLLYIKKTFWLWQIIPGDAVLHSLDTNFKTVKESLHAWTDPYSWILKSSFCRSVGHTLIFLSMSQYWKNCQKRSQMLKWYLKPWCPSVVTCMAKETPHQGISEDW